jgi:CheY-like chemotaxis protein
MVAVSDTGTGMDAATLERAFEPFFTTKEVGKGSGLGLSMVYGFVKQSRGHVRIYSEPGHGTTVKLYLPRAGAEADADAPAAAPADPERGSGRILIVEDDALVRENAVEQLRSLGYDVVAAGSGSEALAALEKGEAFDLLFTDVVMPGGMNGRELAERALALRPGLPVLYTSGYTENAIVHHGRLDRGVDLLAKPYRRQDLAAKVRAVLAAARAR